MSEPSKFDIFIVPVAQLTDFGALAVGSGELSNHVLQSNAPQKVLSCVQQRLWFIAHLEESDNIVNRCAQLIIENAFDESAFKASLQQLIERHAALRTCFQEEDGAVVAVILPETEALLMSDDFSHASHTRQIAMLDDAIKLEVHMSFDLTQGNLMRARILKLSGQSWRVLLCVHPIAADSKGMQILQQELAVLYAAFVQNRPNPLPPMSMQYAGYAQWQQQWLQSEASRNHLRYWRGRLHEMPQVHNLPLDKPRLARQPFEEATFVRSLNKKLRESLLEHLQRFDVTPFAWLQTAFCVLLSRYSNETDIVMGTPVEGREPRDWQVLVGVFENLLILRADLTGNPRFIDLLMRNKQHLLDAEAHRKFPLEKLVDDLKPERSLSYHPLFQILFSWWKTQPHSEEALKNFEWQSRPSIPFDLSLAIIEEDDEITLCWSFNRSLFNADTIERLAANFIVLLESVAADPEKKVHDLDMLTAEEKEKLLTAWNATQAEYPRQLCLHTLFEDQAAATPEHTALIAGNDRRCTYRELNERANRLAHYLIMEGVTSAAPIALYFERSIDSMIALLAILKAGTAYVPLDPDYPESRLRAILHDSKAIMVLTHSEMYTRASERLGPEQQAMLCVDTLLQSSSALSLSHENPGRVTDSATPAYIIYTSGSTGTPKGIAGIHRGMVNRINWMQRTFPADSKEVFCQKTSFSFIDHIAEIFQPLTSGNALVIIDHDTLMNIPVFIEALRKHCVSRITLVPSFLNLLMEHRATATLEHLKYIVSSGEALPLAMVKRVYARLPQVHLINLYGSTEVSADVSYYEINYRQCLELMKYFQGEAPVSLEKITRSHVDLDELKQKFLDTHIPRYPISLQAYYDRLHQDVLPYRINVASRHYIGHMTSALPDFMPELSKLVSQLNQNVVKVETSKSLTFLERQVLAMMHKLFFNLPDKYYRAYCQDTRHMFGIVSSGGTTANVTALWCARNKGIIAQGLGKDVIVRQGAISALSTLGYRDAVIIGTRLLHYSFRKAVSLMGIGENNILIVDQDDDQKLCVPHLEALIKDCHQHRRFIIALVGIAGATETGIIDPLPAMAEVARRHALHFHVDAAWGGALMFSDRYNQRLQGIELADSITFCAHKQLYLPQGMSLCLLRNTADISSISTHADYQAQAGSYDFGQYTLEGSRSAVSLLLHASLHLLAQEGYAWLIDQSMQKTEIFKALLKQSDCFELVGEPQMNIINYRYIPYDLRRQKQEQYNQIQNARIDHAVEMIQQQQFAKGDTFVSKTKILNMHYADDPIWVFRVVLSNPLTTEDNLREVLNDQLEIAEAIIEHGHSVNALYPEQSLPSIAAQDEVTFEQWTVPIGKPIANTQIYILDERLQPVPIGVIGELCVAGESLSMGYINQTELTKEKFIEHADLPDIKGKLYRSGDMAQWLPDGNLKYIGRIDQQVKIRGNRIELGEIEARLMQLDSIREAVVSVHEDCYLGKTLFAYLVLADPGLSVTPAWEQGLRMQLRESLPEYMIPGRLLRLDSLPLTVNGKHDRNALSQLDAALVEKDAAEPQSDTEIRLMAIWSRLLNLSDIDVQQDFFHLGGHSLLTIRMLTMIQQDFGVRIDVREIFEYPTLRSLAARIEYFLNDNNTLYEHSSLIGR